jgi:hypothetical protein
MGGLLLLTRRVRSERVYAEIDWSLLLMFAGLFIIVAGAEYTLLSDETITAVARLHLDRYCRERPLPLLASHPHAEGRTRQAARLHGVERVGAAAAIRERDRAGGSSLEQVWPSDPLDLPPACMGVRGLGSLSRKACSKQVEGAGFPDPVSPTVAPYSPSTRPNALATGRGHRGWRAMRC